MNVDSIKKVLVIGGSGTMGQGIAQGFAEAGLETVITGRTRETCDRAMAQIQKNLSLCEEYGTLNEKPADIFSRLSAEATSEYADLASTCQYVVETVAENLALKQSIFKQLDGIDRNIIIGSDTSSIPVATIAEGCKTPERMIGIHYFNPAHIMPLVEIHHGPETSEEAIAVTRQLMTKAGKTPVVIKKDIFGLLGTRFQLAIIREIESLLAQDVASLEDLNLVAQASYGMRYACIGHIEALDMIGLDTMEVIEKRIFPELSNADGPTPALVDKVAKGHVGVKAGRGWFNYDGIPKEKVLDSQNRRLLKQLKLFKEMRESSEKIYKTES